MTQQIVRDILDYDADTGVFRWRKTRSSNATKGSIAGTISTNGYRQINISGTRYLAHRLAWLYMFGYEPPHTIDHINRVRDDNRISNLRLATISQNTFNQPRRKESAINGVSWHKVANKWRAYISVNGRFKHLGCYRDIDEAVAARLAAEKDMGIS